MVHPGCKNEVHVKARKSELIEVTTAAGEVVRWQFAIEKYDFRLSITFRPNADGVELPPTSIMAAQLVGDSPAAGRALYGAFLPGQTGILAAEIDNTYSKLRPKRVGYTLVSEKIIGPIYVQVESGSPGRDEEVLVSSIV